MAIWEDRKDCEKRKIYYSKFRLDNKAGKALMATLKVKIVNKGPRLKTIVCEKLMETRDHLNYMKQRSVTKLR